MIRTCITSALALAALLVAARPAGAQPGGDLEAEMRKKMEEISRLMRDSERRLLEMTHVDRIVDQQEEIVSRLRELLPPEEAERQAAEEMRKRREQLEQSQQELSRKIQELLDGQKNAGEQTVKQLQELLKNLPRRRQEGGGGDSEEKQQRKPDEQKRLDEQKDEDRRQRDVPQDPKSKQEEEARKREEMRGGTKPKDETDSAARLKRIEAWIARLPPEEQARINRNDFSSIPLRYRQLVQEYTALRAKREAEEDADR